MTTQQRTKLLALADSMESVHRCREQGFDHGVLQDALHGWFTGLRSELAGDSENQAAVTAVTAVAEEMEALARNSTGAMATVSTVTLVQQAARLREAVGVGR